MYCAWYFYFYVSSKRGIITEKIDSWAVIGHDSIIHSGKVSEFETRDILNRLKVAMSTLIKNKNTKEKRWRDVVHMYVDKTRYLNFKKKTSRSNVLPNLASIRWKKEYIGRSKKQKNDDFPCIPPWILWGSSSLGTETEMARKVDVNCQW